MASDAQKAAVHAVDKALDVLNEALDKASDAEVFIELTTRHEISRRNPNYIISSSEIRERVLPS